MTVAEQNSSVLMHAALMQSLEQKSSNTPNKGDKDMMNNSTIMEET